MLKVTNHIFCKGALWSFLANEHIMYRFSVFYLNTMCISRESSVNKLVQGHLLDLEVKVLTTFLCTLLSPTVDQQNSMKSVAGICKVLPLCSSMCNNNKTGTHS